MYRSPRRTQALVALFLASFLALNYPLVAVVDLPVLVAGVPLSYLCLFGGWGVLIAGVAWLVERPR